MKTKIRVILSSFSRPAEATFPAHTSRIRLPVTKTLYTVLQSPHIDKKSREQFETRIQRQILDIKAERHELEKKLFWLKRHRVIGAQMELQVFSKTRLDPSLLPNSQN